MQLETGSFQCVDSKVKRYKEQLEAEHDDRPDEFEDRQGGPEEGGDQDSDPAEQRSEDGPDPQHALSVPHARASRLARPT